MAVIPDVMLAGTFVKVRQVAHNNTQYGINILHFFCDTPIGGPVTVADFASYLDQNWKDAFKAIMPSAAAYHGYGVTKVNVPPAPPNSEWYADANAGPGTQGADMAPPQTCGLVSWRSQFAGRGYRGRTYLPFISDDLMDADGTLSNAVGVTKVQFWADMVSNRITVPNAAATGTIDVRIWLKRGLVIADWVALIAKIVRKAMATQRRRSELNVSDADPFAGSIHV